MPAKKDEKPVTIDHPEGHGPGPEGPDGHRIDHLRIELVRDDGEKFGCVLSPSQLVPTEEELREADVQPTNRTGSYVAHEGIAAWDEILRSLMPLLQGGGDVYRLDLTDPEQDVPAIQPDESVAEEPDAQGDEGDGGE